MASLKEFLIKAEESSLHAKVVIARFGFIGGAKGKKSLINHHHGKVRSSPLRSQPSGMALITVLICLTLLAGIIVTFLATVKLDGKSSLNYNSGVTSRMLAGTALNLVQGQIREASERSNETWISQPGMIRTFNTQGAQTKAYKLYSSNLLVEDGDFNPEEGDDLPGPNWRELVNEWVDLNEKVNGVSPVISAEGLVVRNGRLIYDSDGDTNADIEGFSVDTSSPVVGNVTEVPMPVRWLYLLKNGTLATAESSRADGTVTLKVPAGATPASNTNPPVARLAFWTDDESSKLNLNTAGEGTFWDTPTAVQWGDAYGGNNGPGDNPDVVYEKDLAINQVSKNEYQRYPGHPATTSLSVLLEPYVRQQLRQKLGREPRRVEMVKAIVDLTPTYYEDDLTANSNRTSRAGTRKPPTVDNASTRVPWRRDRLYASVDELAFAPSGSPRKLNPLAPGDEKARALVKRLGFFATTHSRAPELNLFGRPRVSIWPITALPNKQTALDRLFAYCSTIGGKPFYFQRTDPASSTADFILGRNLELYSFLQSQTSQLIPGVGGRTFLEKYPQGSFTPGAGNQAPTERDQILTQIFDYIRCINLQPSDGTAYTFDGLNAHKGGGQVTPIEPPTGGPGAGTRGYGRFLSISDVVFTANLLDNPKPTSSSPPEKVRVEFTFVPQVFTPMAGYSAIWPNMKVKFEGLDGFSYSIRNSDGMTIASGNCFSSIVPSENYPGGTHEMIVDSRVPGNINEYRSGGQMGAIILGSSSTPNPQYTNPNGTNRAQFPTSIHEIPNDDSKSFSFWNEPRSTARMTITASKPLKISLYPPTALGASTYSDTPVFTAEYDFSGLGERDMPAPRWGDRNKTVSFHRRTDNGGPSVRLNDASGIWSTGHDGFKRAGPVTRSIQPRGGSMFPTYGDLRAMAAFRDQGKFFELAPVDSHRDREHSSGHTFKAVPIDDARFYGHTESGNLVSGLGSGGFKNYKINQRPAVPSGIDGVEDETQARPGDWDNGQGIIVDGPYINKPDEGAFSAVTVPYLGNTNSFQDVRLQNQTLFSPNRQVASPLMFGSLPTGVVRGKPWQTLLFRPAIKGLPGGTWHPGAGSPPDHYLADLFWMPVVEPYPISDPLSTAGKVNLNTAIAPFNYIQRDTALRGVLKSVKVNALNPSQRLKPTDPWFIEFSKDAGGAAGSLTGDIVKGAMLRRSIDLDQTLRIIKDRYQSSKETPFFSRNPNITAFVSESEICEVPLIPQDVADHFNIAINDSTSLSAFAQKLEDFWSGGGTAAPFGHRLTGDNLLERPYALLYSRLTTKSNTYRVHVRAQRVTARYEGESKFNIKTSNIDAEYRGSYLLERYLDLRQPEVASYDGTSSLAPYYRFRVLESKQIE
jgi:hypothetical protein